MVALLTAVIGAAFSALVLWRWSRRRHAYHLAWAIGLAMLAVAAFAGFLHRSGGGTDFEYRVFYLFGAILNVSWLGLGTLYLLATRRVARAALWAVLVLSIVGIVAVFTSPVDAAAAADTGRGFESSLFPRILAAIGSAGGSLVLFGGAVWSAYRFLRARANGRRVVANVLIAIAVVVFAAGGTAAFTGTRGVLELANLLGLVLLLAGFLLA